MRVSENASLRSLTTLRVGGAAKRLVVAERESEILETVAEADGRGEALLVLGGGSNLLVADEGFPGTVLQMATRGIDTSSASADRVLVTACAGEPWDDFVTRMVGEGLSGVECLAGIPGLVGAVPMQNVGAYGQDVGETIVRVRTWDRAARRVVDFDRTSCRFAYRDSVFRGREDHVILAVTFELARSQESSPIRYAELARALGVKEGARAPLAEVRETIVRLRRGKGMVLDLADHDTWSAGSFFTNPILDAMALASLRERIDAGATLPEFPEPDGRTKVSAAWLIERAGFAKGHRAGNASISTKHALALTNRGGASAREILELARAIREGVRLRFGVVLENEPVFVGLEL
ncbi:MAG: UDP-N-acetylmuramate dehydrogenase [Deltaproteobacteria bacterium]|nr:UDP-N-acetylmuramate dehydrogenase [Deltaproteobacteria bacterium]